MRSPLLCLVLCAAGPSWALGCGGETGDGQTGVAHPRPGIDTGGAGGLPDASAGGAIGLGGTGSAGTGGNSFRDPECPPPTTKPGVFDCDPFDLTACGPGSACSPYVQYADNCGSETIGTTCSVAGPGVQGDDCTRVTCAAGYVCATGGVGFICVKLCKPEGGIYACEPGLVCTALDVAGFYVCD